MKIYLAGPMRGIPEFNFPTFRNAAANLREYGHVVFSPAEKDCERHGVDISKGNLTGSEEYASKEHGFSLREALGVDLAWICAEAEAVALLPGWEKSKGAVAERATAITLGLKVIYLHSRLEPEYIDKIDGTMLLVRNELLRARNRFSQFRSTHEGYGVLLEEVDELFDEVKKNDLVKAKAEAIQVAAMAASFVCDL